MKNLFQKIPTFLLITVVFICAGLLVLFSVNKIDGHMGVNATHTPFQDFFFKYVTYGGDGLFLVIASVVVSVLFWKRHGISVFIFAALNLSLVAGIVQFLKQYIYYGADRPTFFISKKIIHTIPGVEMYTHNSFPSGHTAAAFAFFAFIALLFPKKPIVHVACVVVAALVGYSRIYLSQHFLEDVVMGGTIGVLCFMITYFFVRILPLKNNLTQK